MYPTGGGLSSDDDCEIVLRWLAASEGRGLTLHSDHGCTGEGGGGGPGLGQVMDDDHQCSRSFPLLSSFPAKIPSQ